jgi:SAM-dependent methyltransferase
MIKLNIACGPNVFPFDGWINYDHVDFGGYFAALRASASVGMPPHQKKLCDHLLSGGEIRFVQHDMNDRFPHDDSSVDAIYVGQAIEHLNPIQQTPEFLKECWRMLRPAGGLLRMTTPDLRKLLAAYEEGSMHRFATDQPDFYKNADPDSQLAFLMYGACGPDCTQERYEGHFFLFTKRSMHRFLVEAGFREIVFYDEPGESLSSVLEREVNDEGMSHSFVVECVK